MSAPTEAVSPPTFPEPTSQTPAFHAPLDLFGQTTNSHSRKNKTPTEPGPESPTTARPLEMDDDDVQETGVLNEEGASKPNTTTATAPASEEAPPPKPPRPMTEQQKHVQILKEAFPGVDETVIKAVLTASNGRIEPAFNALLGWWNMY